MEPEERREGIATATSAARLAPQGRSCPDYDRRALELIVAVITGATIEVVVGP